MDIQSLGNELSKLLRIQGGGQRDKYCAAIEKAKTCKQFKCETYACQSKNAWWGDVTDNASLQCRVCLQKGRELTKAETVGVGWFYCDTCSHVFAGFCRGDVPSVCHRCKTKCIAECIIPGEKASGERKEHKHHCDACQGVPPCPIIEAAKNVRRQEK
jgi:hypothetical protein